MNHPKHPWKMIVAFTVVTLLIAGTLPDAQASGNKAESSTGCAQSPVLTSGSSAQPLGITAPKKKRSNADLSSLTLSKWAAISPVFDPGTTQYNITIPYNKKYLKITPHRSDSAARYSFYVNNKKASRTIRLMKGQSKTIKITVTAQNKTTRKTYTIHVRRSYPDKPDMTPYKDLAPSVFMSFKQLIDDDGTRKSPPKPAALPPSNTYRIEVDLINQYVTAYVKGTDGKHNVPYRYMICSTGMSGRRTPTGTFKLAGRKVRFGYFVNYDIYAQYWTRIVRGIYFHSILYKTRSDKYPYMPSYDDLGTAVSHGCIRLLPPDAKWIYENCAPGTTVVITNKKARDPVLPIVLLPPPV